MTAMTSGVTSAHPTLPPSHRSIIPPFVVLVTFRDVRVGRPERRTNQLIGGFSRTQAKAMEELKRSGGGSSSPAQAHLHQTHPTTGNTVAVSARSTSSGSSPAMGTVMEMTTATTMTTAAASGQGAVPGSGSGSGPVSGPVMAAQVTEYYAAHQGTF